MIITSEFGKTKPMSVNDRKKTLKSKTIKLKSYPVEILPKNLKKHYLTYGCDVGYRIISPASSNNKFPSDVEFWMKLPNPDLL
jgi:hypothetical protein